MPSNFVKVRDSIESGFVSFFHSLQSLLKPAEGQVVTFAQQDGVKIADAVVGALQAGTLHNSGDLIDVARGAIDKQALESQGVQLGLALSTSAAAGLVHLAAGATQEDPGAPPVANDIAAPATPVTQ